MSDTDCDSIAKTPTQRVRKPATASKHKVQSSCTNLTRSDSEDESVSQTKPAPKRKPPLLTNTTKNQKKKLKTIDVFGLCNDDIEANDLKTKEPCALPSYIVNRVANGHQRRLAPTRGEFYVDVKVYARDDAENTASDARWTRALLRLNCYLGEDSTQWKLLKRFVKEVDVFYEDSVPTFYSDTLNIKKK